jgi:hypothetical protein
MYFKLVKTGNGEPETHNFKDYDIMTIVWNPRIGELTGKYRITCSAGEKMKKLPAASSHWQPRGFWQFKSPTGKREKE